ncbi:hypothetical protein [Peterkaempfera sp. SMS 1(5)a]|uniref:hypothetical protein n=1 Tax=Peterkaempfera podocarpi TaxID=3232308 RepID=UPI00367077DC
MSTGLHADEFERVPAEGAVRAIRAGRPPPLPRHTDGRTEVLDIPGGVLLGEDRRRSTR